MTTLSQEKDIVSLSSGETRIDRAAFFDSLIAHHQVVAAEVIYTHYDDDATGDQQFPYTD